MPDTAYQNKDITSNLPTAEANKLRPDNLFLLENSSLDIVDYESDYRYEDTVKYLNYPGRCLLFINI